MRMGKRFLSTLLSVSMVISMTNLAAYAQDGELVCGLEEHVHTEACYEDRQILTCELTEEGHTHGEECYAEELICEEPEVEAEPHVHGDECYTVSIDRELVCEDESEEHVHEDGCYEETEVEELTCTETGTEGHAHGAGCYESTLTCEETEEEGHTHGEECYEVEQVLVCDKEEHTHDEECYEQDVLQDEVVLLTEAMPLEETVEKEPQELAAYLAENGGSISSGLLNTDDKGTPVEKDENGNPIIELNTTYYLVIDIKAPGGFIPGEYYYEIEGVTVTQATEPTPLEVEGLGTWSVKDNVLGLDIKEDYTGVTIKTQVVVMFTGDAENTKLPGDVQVIIRPDQKRTPGLTKDGWKNITGANAEEAPMIWQVTATGGDDFRVVGGTITDSVAGDSHEINSNLWVEVSAGKSFYCSVRRADGTLQFHGWNVGPADSPEWQASGLQLATVERDSAGRALGWEYTVPTTVKCAHCGEEIDLKNDYTYTITYSSKPIEIPASGKGTYVNEVTLGDKSADKEIDLYFNIKGCEISKHMDPVAGSDFAKKWTIEVDLPAAQPDADHLFTYVIEDRAGVLDAYSDIVYEYNSAGMLAENGFMQDLKVVVIVDGQRYEALPYQTAGNAKFVYDLWKQDERGIQIVLGMPYKQGAAHGEGCVDVTHLGICTCWRLEQDAQVEITYTTPDVAMLSLMSQYGMADMQLANLGSLYTKQAKSYCWLGEYLVTTRLDGVFEKDQGGNLPSASNNYTVEYNIKVNEMQLPLDTNTVTIVDKMTGLSYVDGSVKITETTGKTSQELAADKYELTWEDTSKTLTIVLKDTLEKKSMYTIHYETRVTDSNAKFSNAATVELFGMTFKRKVDSDASNSSSSTGNYFALKVQKVSSEDKSTLEGAKFGLYGAVDKNGDAKTVEGTTDSRGEYIFRSGALSKLVLSEHTLYYVQELEAPEGYQKDETPHYFYFCKAEGDGCAKCEEVQEKVPAGATAERYKGGISTMTVENKPEPPKPTPTPTEPKPTESTEPEESTKPTESTEPTEPTKPEESTKPTESTEPTEPTKPEESTTPTTSPEESETPTTSPDPEETQSPPPAPTSTPNDGDDDDDDTPRPTPKPTPTPTASPAPAPTATPSSEPSAAPAPAPEEPEELVDLDDEIVPLGDLPDELFDLGDVDVPRSGLPEEFEDFEELEDGRVPLAQVPQTGDNTIHWLTVALLSGTALAWLNLKGKKREDTV